MDEEAYKSRLNYSRWRKPAKTIIPDTNAPGITPTQREMVNDSLIGAMLKHETKITPQEVYKWIFSQTERLTALYQ